jgi:hypothetical protein
VRGAAADPRGRARATRGASPRPPGGSSTARRRCRWAPARRPCSRTASRRPEADDEDPARDDAGRDGGPCKPLDSELPELGPDRDEHRDHDQCPVAELEAAEESPRQYGSPPIRLDRRAHTLTAGGLCQRLRRPGSGCINSTVLDVDTPHGEARAHVHEADRPRAALVLGHGAAGGASSPLAIHPARRYIGCRAVSVAQLVELLVVVQAVAGSNPVAHPSGTRC